MRLHPACLDFCGEWDVQPRGCPPSSGNGCGGVSPTTPSSTSTAPRKLTRVRRVRPGDDEGHIFPGATLTAAWGANRTVTLGASSPGPVTFEPARHRR
jgi:hypothetical protein